MDEGRYRDVEERLWASLGVTPTERQLRLERIGTTIRVQELGEGPPVVFVHGGSINGTCWAPLAALLDDFRCIVIDRPGCGLSAPFAKRFDDVERFGAFADDLIVDVLDGLGLDAAHVVATSFGGYMALHSAAAHPDRIDRMVEFGWPFGAPIAKVPLVMRIGSAPGVGLMLTKVPVNERAARTILRGIGLREAMESGRLTQPMLDWFVALLRHTDTMRNEINASPRVITPIHGMNEDMLIPDGLLASIRAPMYFLWGEQDPYGGEATARRFIEPIPNAELEMMPAAGHAVWMDDAHFAAERTRRFLSGRPTPAAGRAPR